MSQINDLSGDEEKYIQALTGLVSFGIFKFLVVPYLKDLNEMQKAYFKKATQQKKEDQPVATPPHPTTDLLNTPLNAPASSVVWERKFF